MNKKITYADFFCGLGAFHYAFNKYNKRNKHNINYECVFCCDINKDVRKLYKENYDHEPESDINNINIKTIPDFQILCAGFPCQSFSIAGKKTGFEDKIKGKLFYKLLEIIDEKNPEIIFLENVKNLHKINNGETFKEIQDELEKRKYIFNYQIIDSKHYGSAQSRERIFIICSKEKKFLFPKVDKKMVPVSQIIDKKNENFYDYKDKYDLVECKNKSSMMKYKLVNKKTGKGGRQGERVYSIDNFGPTICASSGGPGSKTGFYMINGKIRTLNIKETLLMFGFKKYKYSSVKQKNKMLFFLGNSIVVNVLYELIKQISNIYYKNNV